MFVYENIGVPVSRELVAKRLGLNPSHVSKLFHRFAKEKFNDYVSRIKIEKAVELMKSNHLSVGELAGHCGFSGSATFIKVFHKFYGTSPGKYKGRLACGKDEGRP